MSGRGQAVNLGGSSKSPIITIILPGLTPAVGTDITSNWLRVPAGGLNFVGATAHIVARTAPAGSNAVIFDLKYSTNNGSSFSDLLGSPKLTLAVGSRVADIATPNWQVTTLDEGDLIRVDVTQIDNGTAADFAITIEFV